MVKGNSEVESNINRLADISKTIESVEIELCNLVDTWKETLKRQYDNAIYNRDTGLWEYKDNTRVECARYSMMAYQNASKIVADLGQTIDNIINDSRQ